MTRKHERPVCFGVMETVFPLKEDGLRHSPESCLACVHKTDCLRTAMKGGDGLQVREEIVDRSYASQKIGFLERWSRRKYLSQLKEKQREGES